MRFGEFPLENCEGAYLAHSVKAKGVAFRKGLKLTSKDINALGEAGVETIIAAILEVDDVHEDDAAAIVAAKVCGASVSCRDAFTGRANLIAEQAGILLVDRQKIDRLNSIDESITIATLSDKSMVQQGQMVATSKIIPLSVSGVNLRSLDEIDLSEAIYVRPYEGKKCRIIQTELASVKPSIYDKSAAVLKARLRDFGASCVGENRCSHTEATLMEQLTECNSSDQDIILIMGASAITDRRDVIPAAIERAGGKILHFGMPVDPGNLLLVAKLGGTWVLGLPGCARSPKLNGVDHILSRLCAGMHIRATDIMGMGVGGLLNEYVGRPQPRAGKAVKHTDKPSIAVAVLAAGRSSRMGPQNKLLLPYREHTVLEHVLTEIQAAGCDTVFVVTGHEQEKVTCLAKKFGIKTVHNAAYSEGMSTSVKAAIAGVDDTCDGVLMVLGDMPGLTSEVIRTIVGAYNPADDRNLIVPVHKGKQGNPVLWGREYFPSFETITGDKGAKPLLVEFSHDIHEVDVQTDAIFLDIDTLEAYLALTNQER